MISVKGRIIVSRVAKLFLAARTRIIGSSQSLKRIAAKDRIRCGRQNAWTNILRLRARHLTVQNNDGKQDGAGGEDAKSASFACSFNYSHSIDHICCRTSFVSSGICACFPKNAQIAPYSTSM